jgi:hypothetical protein
VPARDVLGRVGLARADAHAAGRRLPDSRADLRREHRALWISAEPVEPLELVELGDLAERHEAAAIDLRTEPDLLGFWDEVIESSLGFSGIRLRNARMPA